MSDKNQKQDLSGLDSCLSGAQSVVQEFMSAVRSLPKVNADGSSECPFAKELYAKKEKLKNAAQGYLGQLQEYSRITQKLIGKCKNDMTVISANEDRLNNDRPRSHFSEAEAAVAAQYKQLIRKHKKIKETTKLINTAMQEASQKSFPGGLPGRTPQSESGQAGKQDPFKADSCPAGADKEIEELLRFEHEQLADDDGQE